VTERWVVVFNPASGGADEDDQIAVTKALEAGGPVDVVAPKNRDSFASELRRAAQGAAVVVSAGGDGTMNATLNALYEVASDVRLGLIPMGTGNDLARTLNLSDDPVETASELRRGRVRKLDVGKASGPGVERLFINACMGGFPVDANEAIDENTKKRFGPLAFWLGGAKALKELTRSRLSVNGTTVDDCVAAGVGNGRTCGGGMPVWPSAEPDDGRLNGCALAAANIAQALALAAKLKLATHEELSSVVTEAAPMIEIQADPDIEFNVDGELIGLRSPAQFEVVGTVSFVVPSNSAAR
jgi:diacylglycerol kinase (ATP)